VTENGAAGLTPGRVAEGIGDLLANAPEPGQLARRTRLTVHLHPTDGVGTFCHNHD
jgi:hypothetical protein